MQSSKIETCGCRLCTLYSGSGGNSTYISGGGSSILIDAGKGASDKLPVDAIFITHEHVDHIGALAVFLKKYPIPVHVTAPSAEKLYRVIGDTPAKDCIVVHSPLFTVGLGNMTVSSFPTSHDSAMSVGYRISVNTEDSVHLLGYATDLGEVTPAVEQGLLGCEAVVLESNHDENLLLDGPYPYDLKMRIRSRHGHLSNTAAAEFAATLAANGTTHFLLAHLSKENNLPEFAYDATLAALADERLTLRVAHPDVVTFLLGENEPKHPEDHTDPVTGGAVVC